MQWSDLPFNPERRVLRQFAFAWIAFFGLSAAYQTFWGGNGLLAGVSAGLAIAVGLPGLLKPALLRWLFLGLTIATFPIGWTVSNVVLACLFYGVFTPLGLLFRILKRDPLALRRPGEAVSYWVSKPMSTDLHSYLRQF